MKTFLTALLLLLGGLVITTEPASAACLDFQGEACWIGTTNNCHNGNGIGIYASILPGGYPPAGAGEGEEHGCVRIDN